jgi:pyruvate/2-oxoglutarate dehydrogenase complex dihydrolipoamide acyltransferase (E2) component
MDQEIIPFPSERNPIVDAGYLAARRHVIHGLFEVDVTRARELIARIGDPAQDGEAVKKGGLSFTAYVVACLARAIEAHPKVQAYFDWRRRLVLFKDVDVVTLIEPEAGRAAIPHIIRAADRKTVRQINDEIRSVQARPARSAQSGGLVALGAKAPRWVRMLFYHLIKLNPRWFKQTAGTVIVTSVGVMFGKSAGWGIIFLPHHTTGLTVGGLVQKPAVFEGQIAIREFLSLTLSFDHDIVDGAPAARFAKDFKDLLESAELLEKEL